MFKLLLLDGNESCCTSVITESRTPTSSQASELPVVHSPTGTQCHPFTIRLISHNPLTVMMTRIVSCVGIKAMSCDSLNNGNTFLIPGQALLTPVTAVTVLQESGEKVHFVFEEDQRTPLPLIPHRYLNSPAALTSARAFL